MVSEDKCLEILGSVLFWKLLIEMSGKTYSYWNSRNKWNVEIYLSRTEDKVSRVVMKRCGSDS